MDDFKKQLKVAYNADAKRRDTSESTIDQWKLDLRENFANILKTENKRTILELGSGVGLDAKFFKDNGFYVLATDLSEEMINMCKKRDLNAQVLDLYDIENLNKTFDAVYSLNVLLHVPKKDLRQVLKSIYNILNPGGIFFYGVYGGINFEEVTIIKNKINLPRLFSYFTDEDILETVKELFEVVKFENIEVSFKRPGFHFQSLILRKR